MFSFSFFFSFLFFFSSRRLTVLKIHVILRAYLRRQFEPNDIKRQLRNRANPQKENIVFCEREREKKREKESLIFALIIIMKSHLHIR